MRERRSAEKLAKYFREYLETKKINANVHPQVGESWQRSGQEKVASGVPKAGNILAKAALEERQACHSEILEHMESLCSGVRSFFGDHGMSILLTDEEGYVLSIYGGYSGHFCKFQVGQRISEEDIGTTSLPIAYLHQATFILFDQEMWQRWIEKGWMGTAPIVIDGEVRYGVTFLSDSEEDNIAYTLPLLETFRTSLEKFVEIFNEVKSQRQMLDAVPLALYRIRTDSQVVYANQLGKQRLATISPHSEFPKLDETVINYERTPLAKAAKGVPTYNKEITWTTQRKNYNDITTAIPIEWDGEVEEVVCVTMPIEDLRALVAHAAGFSAKYTLESLYGQAPIFTAMKEKAERVAKQRMPILLLGESGTGKQRLAHGIHQASERAEGPYISIKFGDSPLELVEMELFGRVDANGDSHSGKFELADGGTLFLNTLEKMPQALSSKLLQAVAQGVVYRPGETVPRTVNVRIIGSSDVELKRLVDRGEFSGELYHWLSRSVIRVPALNARKSDIPLLARHIIEELATQNNLPMKELSPDAVEVLLSYDWPRNIKQLQFVVEQAFFRTSALLLTGKDILLPGADQKSQAWKEDKETFMELWNAAGGNVSRLANMLRVSRVTLYRYMKKHGVVKE